MKRLLLGNTVLEKSFCHVKMDLIVIQFQVDTP